MVGWHELPGLLAVAVCAVLAGAKSFAAIGEWAADAPAAVLRTLGIPADPLTGVVRPPDEATVRRVLAGVSGDALDEAVVAWLGSHAVPGRATTSGKPGPARAIAVDGKTLRDSSTFIDSVRSVLDGGSGEADSWVEGGVEQVDQQVEHEVSEH